MKKIIFIFLTLFIFISNSEALSKFHIAEKVPNMHIESVRDIGIHNGVPFIIRRDDGQFVYCLERPKDINENGYYKEYYYNDKLFNLTDEQLERINLLGFYGYQYKDHTDIKWYGVTQFLIWGTLYQDVYFTDKRYGERIDAYVSEINEIENLIENYYTLPSFSNNDFEYSINSSYELLDSNGILNNYEIKSSNIDSYISNNKLYINTKEDGDYEINFIRKSPAKENYILYGLTDSQPLIYPGKVNDIEFKIDIKVSSGSITINKSDSENKIRDFATLEGAIYGIYDEKELITTIETDENGIAFIDKLPLNQKYYIKEITPSIGYKLDPSTYEVILSNDKKDYIISLDEEVIKGNLIINKYYGKENDYELEGGAVFEIYDIEDNLVGTYETDNGIINTELDYGGYYGIQIKGKVGYSFVDKFNISIKEEKDYVFDLYNEKVLIVEVPDTKKNDYTRYASIIFITIGLLLVLKSIKKTTHFG